jgi:hypothetical protein
MLLTLIPIWQFIIIPGIIAGVINKSLKHGVLSGLLGVTLSWGIYILVGMYTRNVGSILNQFGEMIFGDNLGGIFIVLILLLAAIFGAIGGGIGNAIMGIIEPYLRKHTSKASKLRE